MQHFPCPVCGSSCDVILSVFAPFSPEEVLRVLAPGGWIRR